MASNIRVVYDTLVQGGLSPMAAQAMVARFQQESGPGLNTVAHGDRNLPGGSHGIAQWNRGRLDGLKKFGGDNWTDAATQARYVLHELNTSEKAAGDMLRSARDPQTALLASMNYERPQGWTRQNPAGGHGFANTQRNYMQLGEILNAGGGRGVTLNSNPMAQAAVQVGTPTGGATVAVDNGAASGLDAAAVTTPLALQGATTPAADGTTATAAAQTPLQKAGALLEDKDFVSGLSGLAKGLGLGGGGQAAPQQQAAPVPQMAPPVDDSAQRMAAAQPMLASLLAKRRGRVPGLSLMG